MADTKLDISGRKFELAGEKTARHDMYTMRQIAACGLNVVGRADDESEELFMHRLYLTALNQGDIFLLLGALLVPQGTKAPEWSEQIAVETAEFFANLTKPEDKAKIRILLASALMPFFTQGLRLSKTFRRSSQLPSPVSDRPLTESADTRSTAIGV
jgi:hypothetical protein